MTASSLFSELLIVPSPTSLLTPLCRTMLEASLVVTVLRASGDKSMA